MADERPARVFAGLDVSWARAAAAVEGTPAGRRVCFSTGGLLAKLALTLTTLVVPGGTLILSGITTEEAPDVERVFAEADCQIASRVDEDGWVGLRLTSPTART